MINIVTFFIIVFLVSRAHSTIPEESQEVVKARAKYGRVPEKVREKVQVGPFKIPL